RWPRFAPAAVRAGYRSLVAARLSPDGAAHSALTVYASAPGGLDASARLTAGLFALQAAVLLYGAEHAARLDHATGSRDVVGQAKGILMERFVVDDDEAFQVLALACRDAELGLVDLARWVTRDAGDRRERNRRGHPRPASAVPEPG
ncbi:MAG: ANTAR domain-containing protein, partial [Actinomycetota bacterium]|nr:ANTAR domain-containing protein [Actinomycetota bacterium]